MPASSSTSVSKTYKDETITLFGRMQIGATNTQPTLLTDNGASKGFTGASLILSGPSISRYQFTLDPSIRVVNILGFTANVLRTPGAGFSTGPGLIVYDYTLGTPGVGATVILRGAQANGGSIQLPQNSTLELTLVITTSNIL
jgi:hypothetical protein